MVAQSGDIAETKQSPVGGDQREAKHLSGRCKESVRRIGVRQREMMRG